MTIRKIFAFDECREEFDVSEVGVFAQRTQQVGEVVI